MVARNSQRTWRGQMILRIYCGLPRIHIRVSILESHLDLCLHSSIKRSNVLDFGYLVTYFLMRIGNTTAIHSLGTVSIKNSLATPRASRLAQLFLQYLFDLDPMLLDLLQSSQCTYMWIRTRYCCGRNWPLSFNLKCCLDILAIRVKTPPPAEKTTSLVSWR